AANPLDDSLRNVISGNRGTGVLIDGTTSDVNNIDVSGNYIGTDKNGTSALGNGSSGVTVTNSNGTINIGIDSAVEIDRAYGNVISGNTGSGISVSDGGSSLTVSGNLIGTDKNGTSALANTANGITLVNVQQVAIGVPVSLPAISPASDPAE